MPLPIGPQSDIFRQEGGEACRRGVRFAACPYKNPKAINPWLEGWLEEMRTELLGTLSELREALEEANDMAEDASRSTNFDVEIAKTHAAAALLRRL